jgi:glycosyltransferase involved in cell wall biosynthesis
MSPRASVIVPTYNKARYLERTLASWTLQEHSDYELIVNDDGSTDGTRDVLRRFESRLPLRYQSCTNGGRAVARNRALSLARGDIIIFSDDDRIVDPRFVSAHISALDAAQGNFVMVGTHQGFLAEVRAGEGLRPAMALRLAEARQGWREALMNAESFETVSADELEQNLREYLALLCIPDPWFEYAFVDVLRKHGASLSGFGLTWTLGATGNMSVRADALSAVGNFDESFVGWGLEDFELHYRLERDGATTRLCSEALNYHQNHARNVAELDASFRRNARLFMEKHGGIEPALFFLHAKGVVSLVDAGQMAEDVAALGGSTLARTLPEILRTAVQWLPDPPR